MWKPVKTENDLIECAKIRYMKYFDSCWYGNDDTPRIISKRYGVWESFNSLGNVRSGTAFTEMVNPEIWIDDTTPAPNPEPPKKPEPSKPVHMGYEWDGIRYMSGRIGENSLEDHDKKIEDLKAELKLLQLQKRRYRDLELRGLY